MASIIPSDRASLVNGLHALADYLEKASHAPRSAALMLVLIAWENSKAANENAVIVCADSETVTLASAHGSTAVLAGAATGMLAILVAGIHRDDRAKTLTCPPKSRIQAATRRLLGVGVRSAQPDEDEGA